MREKGTQEDARQAGVVVRPSLFFTGWREASLNVSLKAKQGVLELKDQFLSLAGFAILRMFYIRR